MQKHKKRNPKVSSSRSNSNKHHESITYGVHAVRSLLLHNANKVDMIYLVRGKKQDINTRLQEIETLARQASIKINYLSPEELETSQLIYEVVKGNINIALSPN